MSRYTVLYCTIIIILKRMRISCRSQVGIGRQSNLIHNRLLERAKDLRCLESVFITARKFFKMIESEIVFFGLR